MERIRFHISLTSDEFLRYYNGSANALIVKAEDGRRIQLPAGRFREFVTEVGIYGYFEIELGPANKLLRVIRLSKK